MECQFMPSIIFIELDPGHEPVNILERKFNETLFCSSILIGYSTNIFQPIRILKN